MLLKQVMLNKNKYENGLSFTKRKTVVFVLVWILF